MGVQRVGAHDVTNESGVSSFSFINDDDSDANPVALQYGVCYIVDNDGVISPGNDILMELPTQVASDVGRSICIRTRYTDTPYDFDSGSPGMGIIDTTGGNVILEGGGTVTKIQLLANDENIELQADGSGNWIHA